MKRMIERVNWVSTWIDIYMVYLLERIWGISVLIIRTVFRSPVYLLERGVLIIRTGKCTAANRKTPIRSGCTPST
jgi:hypothetical protein